MAIRDESVQFLALGLGDQLKPLAALLNETTRLGEPTSTGFMPNATGPDAVLVRVVNPLALHYLRSLHDLEIPNPELAKRLAHELKHLAEGRNIARLSEIVLSGITVPVPLEAYRRVTLRALSPSERGTIYQRAGMMPNEDLSADLDFNIPHSFSFFNPVTLLSIRTTRPAGQPPDNPQLIRRVVLALILHGFHLASPGMINGFDETRWASSGISGSPLPVSDQLSASPQAISREQLEAAVDLAYKMPDFGLEERNREEIALDRVLRGSGAREGSLLDFAIALEAALLGGAQTELSYRFSLYGALFLSEDRKPGTTFRQLKRIYKVRSDLVHGTPVKADTRRAAEADAGDLARAVVQRALEDGWPDKKELDEQALASSSRDNE